MSAREYDRRDAVLPIHAGAGVIIGLVLGILALAAAIAIATAVLARRFR